MRDSLGGAALTVLFGLMALLFSSGAGAVIDLDADGQVKSQPAVTYAQETLTTDITGKDGGTYYVVNGNDDLLHIDGALDVSGSKLVIDYIFTGMVFTDSSNLTITVGGGPDCTENAVATSRRTGGAAGESMVSYVTTVDVTNEEARACLAVTAMAVAPGALAGVTRITEDTLLPTRPVVREASYSGAVAVRRALMISIIPNSPTALVATGFSMFAGPNGSGPMTKASLGSIELDLAEGGDMFRNAADGMVLTELDNGGNTTAGLAQLVDVGASGETISTVMFSGDFSFADAVRLDTDINCSTTTGAGLLKRDAGIVTDTMETMPVALSSLISDTPMHLCIHVPEMDARIGDTDNYVAVTKYMQGSISNQAFPPIGQQHGMGRIMRDGTTVRISYLTTFPDYNQRIVIVNRGGMVPYSLWFHTEEGVMTTSGSDSEGMLPANAVTYLSMMYDDVVTIEGSYRVAATLIVEAEPRHIDVIVSQTNGNGGTDTVRYPAVGQ